MKLFQKVRLQGCFPQGVGTTGKVIGHGTFVRVGTQEQHEGVIVELDEGFFNQAKNLYVNILVVGKGELEEISDPITAENVNGVLSSLELEDLFALPSTNVT